MELKELYNKGWISNFIESGLKGGGQIMYGLLQGSISVNGFRFFPLQGAFRCLPHTSFPCSFHIKQKTPLVSYFFLRKVHVKFHRSTLVQGVESPGRKTKKAMGWHCPKQRTRSKDKVRHSSISWIFIVPGCKTKPREKCGLSAAQLTTPADSGNCRLLPYYFVRSGFQGRGA